MIAAAAAFFAIGGVGWVAAGAMGDAQSKKRMERAVGNPTDRLRRGNAGPTDQAAQRRKQVQESLKDMEQRQKDARAKTLTLKARIQQAGMSFTPVTFWLVSLGLAVGGFLIALLTGQSLLLSGGIAMVCGLGLPRWWLGFLPAPTARSSPANSPTRSTLSCAVSSRACRSMNV